MTEEKIQQADLGPRDMVGQRFGRLLVLSAAARRRYWRVVCDCGGTKEIREDNLRRGRSTSCGCGQRAAFEKNSTPVHGHARTGKNSATYLTWRGMLRRCLTPSHKYFRYYGGRGVTVCDSWMEFENFLADMGERPAGKTLDRIEGAMVYSPENCRWATPKEQAVNRRSTVFIEHDGLRLCVADWARRIHIAPETLRNRIRTGLPLEKALSSADCRTRAAVETSHQEQQ